MKFSIKDFSSKCDQIRSFLERKDTIITNADKGGAVVITDVEKYINESNHLTTLYST